LSDIPDPTARRINRIHLEVPADLYDLAERDSTKLEPTTPPNARLPRWSGGRPTSASELNLARQVIERSGVVDALEPFIDAEVGRQRHLRLLGLLVACDLNALGRGR